MAPATHNHTSRLIDRPQPLNLLDARDFADLASRVGIQQPAQALILDGRLLRIHVGRRAYYRWDDVLPLMPDWAREAYAYLGTPKAHTTDDMRPDLAHQRHTITVERLDARSAREVNMPDQAGLLVVVERHHGRIGKIMAVSEQGMAEVAAANTAHTYGVTYVPAVTR